MLKKMLPGACLAIGILLAPAGFAQGMALDCAGDAAQCDAACDGEKRWGMYKGKKYQECAARCEEQLARQCKTSAGGVNEPMAGGQRGDKVHPQGKQYGYEKNADKVKGQHGAAVSAASRRDGADPDDFNTGEAGEAIEAAKGAEINDVEIEADLEEQAEQLDAEAMEAQKEKAQKAIKDKQKGRQKEKRD